MDHTDYRLNRIRQLADEYRQTGNKTISDRLTVQLLAGYEHDGHSVKVLAEAAVMAEGNIQSRIRRWKGWPSR